MPLFLIFYFSNNDFIIGNKNHIMDNLTGLIRVEYKDGYGMFISKKKRYVLSDSKSDKNILGNLWRKHSTWAPDGGFPIPYDDEKLDICWFNKKWFCAFKNKTIFKNWIDFNEFKELVKIGFKVFLLEVAEYQEGKFQVLYTKESVITSIDITQELLINY